MTDNPATPPAGVSPAEKITFDDCWAAIEAERARCETWAVVHAGAGKAELAAIMRRRARVWALLLKTIDRVAQSEEIKSILRMMAAAEARAAEQEAAERVAEQEAKE